ncbi:SulP family inorganic anion transporter [Octadecabacter antarcticus]|uniref:SulP family inorganic anion transporter n=1 Tax=Octadecabacter antarcticus TaxID=1217908 RepID=UPI0001806350|nr:SulP family inorganic anion transporter [Octadecabacter antarcticus]
MKPQILTALTIHDWQQFTNDLIAEVSVAMVALPLSFAIAIAIASGAGLESGLVTAIVAGLLISSLGGSHVQIGGPTGAFVVIVFGVITEHGFDRLVFATIMASIIILVADSLQAIGCAASRGVHRKDCDALGSA